MDTQSSFLLSARRGQSFGGIQRTIINVKAENWKPAREKFGAAHTTQTGLTGILENRNISQDAQMYCLEAQKPPKTSAR